MKGRKIRHSHNNYTFPFYTISANSSLPAGKGKEEKEGREKRNRKWKNVTGDGNVFGRFRNSSVSVIRDAHFCANALQVPDPSQVTVMATQRLVAVWLSEGLLRSFINTASTVWDLDIRNVCWRDHRLMGAAFVMRRLETEVHFLMAETLLSHTMDMPGTRCNFKPSKTTPFSKCHYCIHHCNLVFCGI